MAHDSWLPWKHISMYFLLKYQHFEKLYKGTFFKIKFAKTFLQYVL